MEVEFSTKDGTLDPQNPNPAPVEAKYTPDNPPTGWSYINYKNQPGGGFQCPNCNRVEDGADVDGHSCN
ncbi:hypothetical protein [Microbulbifer variabilis]|uniref:hypothetical protein n=1 Tax=Microbulbifer variabilis TaxID=266805 RepID=UPI0012FA67D6|nr:hypothetical protein [Microbulbifer variabilis]